MRRVRARIRLTSDERSQLQSISRKKTSAYSLVQRAKIILFAEKHQNNTAVAAKLNICTDKVSQWTHRWVDLKTQDKPIVERLSDAKRSGKPSTITAHQLCQLVALACDNPDNYDRPISHWTQPELTEEAIKQKIFTSISSRHVGRLLAQLELRPHKTQYWLHKKIDALREQKITEICTLYQEAADLKKLGIVTVSVDEMTGVQALERASETLPMKQGKLERPEYEYIRHGTQCLFAGLDVATGEVFGVCQQHRKEDDFVDFIKALEVHHYGFKQLYIVADNLNTHQSESLVRYVAKISGFEDDLGIKGKKGILKSQKSRASFLSRKKHKIVFCYTPKHASWMNQIEIWFGILAKKVLKRGNFISVENLKSKLLEFINYHNKRGAKPYNWKYSGNVLTS